jgi:hypothetical protein
MPGDFLGALQLCCGCLGMCQNVFFQNQQTLSIIDHTQVADYMFKKPGIDFPLNISIRTCA